MNRVRVSDETQVQPERAKHLRRSDSGVFALHGAESANANGVSQEAESFPARVDRAERLTRQLAALGRNAARTDGLKLVDVGAQWNVVPAKVHERLHRDSDRRAPAMTGAQVVLLMALSPSFFAAVVEMVSHVRSLGGSW